LNKGIELIKPENEYNDNDFGMLQLNSKAKHVLFCAVGPNKFNRISSCDTAKEMWDLLEVTYEGTNQVKESKISMLVHEYELFMMHSDECISDMFTRFTIIVNSLKNLGKSYSNQELQILGSLMTHETTMKNHEHVELKKKKTIALNALREESKSDEDDDIVLISKQF
ncbi:UBN2 domain-containing protein, partial [Cephalotus follicularis]